MKNIALIIAGGVGARMHKDIPKQFINVKDKPVIMYTLEAFQKHPYIDAIEVVCLDGCKDVENHTSGCGTGGYVYSDVGGNEAT